MLIVLTQYTQTNRADENNLHEKKFRKVFKQVRTFGHFSIKKRPLGRVGGSPINTNAG